MLISGMLQYIFDQIINFIWIAIKNMIEKGNLRGLNEKQRACMKLLFEITENRRKIMVRVDEQMQKQFKNILDQTIYKCTYCGQSCKGAAIGWHYRMNQVCKYMKDRPFLKQLPENWREDLNYFLKDQQKLEFNHNQDKPK